MKRKLLMSFSVALLALAVRGSADPLSVTSSVTPDGGEYDYSYTFTVASGYLYDDIFLGSDDASPQSIAIKIDGHPTSDWSWLANDTPLNYLQFFSTDNSFLSGETLDVTFTSVFAPGGYQFAEALDDANGLPSNVVVGVIAPTAIPEPTAVVLAGIGLLGGGIVAGRFSGRKQ